MLFLLACVDPPDPAPRPELDGDLLVAATTADDYSAGGLAVVGLDPDGPASPVDVTSLHGDAVVQVDGTTIYAINRLGMDTIRRYDTLDGLPTWELSTGRGSNPQAAAGSAGGRLLVTRYAEPEAWIVDAADGALLDTVDLGELADGDGIPEAAGAVVEGERAFVAIQRIARPGGWIAEPEGRIAIVDLATGTLEASHAVGPNPILAAHPAGGVLVAAEDGLWRVEPEGAVGPTLPDGLEGVVGSLDVADDGRLVLVTRACADCPEHRIVCMDAWDGEVVDRTPPVSAYLSDVVVHRDEVWVAARRSWADPEGVAGGFVVLSLDDCADMPPPSSWRRGTFAPFDLAVLEGA